MSLKRVQMQQSLECLPLQMRPALLQLIGRATLLDPQAHGRSVSQLAARTRSRSAGPEQTARRHERDHHHNNNKSSGGETDTKR